jgi:hypothetical protein
MHTNLYQEYLAALAHRGRERTEQAVACLPFLVDPQFRRRGESCPEPAAPGGQPRPATGA